MPQRIIGLLVGLLGLLVVGGIIVLGLDIWKARRTGPAWKRRLVEAGLLLLALVGFPACEDSATTGAAADTTAHADSQTMKTDLAQSGQWRHLAATWREAQEIASGKRGSYPFDEAGKKRILAELSGVAEDLAGLQKLGLLNAPEAGLLEMDLALLREGVQAMRPVEMRMATCYEPMAFVPPASESMSQLADRLPLLEELAASEKLHPEVLGRALARIENHLKVLGTEDLLGELPAHERARALALREEVRAQVERVKARLAAERGGPQDAPGLPSEQS